MEENVGQEKTHVFWLRSPHRSRISKKNSRLGRGEPVTLVAYRVEGDDIRYATATRCPTDAFNRLNAHNKALGRLSGSTTHVVCKASKNLSAELTIVYDIILRLDKQYDDDVHDRALYNAANASVLTLRERFEHSKKKGT